MNFLNRPIALSVTWFLESETRPISLQINSKRTENRETGKKHCSSLKSKRYALVDWPVRLFFASEFV
jgi:hypothetical protein